MRWPCLHGRQMLCDTTPRRASVAAHRLWHVAARIWHEPPADTCSMVSATSPSHPRSIKIIIPDFPLFSCNFLWDIASIYIHIYISTTAAQTCAPSPKQSTRDWIRIPGEIGWACPHRHPTTFTATETYPKLVFFTLKKIKGFCTLIKKSSTSEKN